MTILLVDDEPARARETAAVLEERGYLVTVVHSGAAALDAVKENQLVDLVLMDVDLGPGMDGPAAARAIVEHHGLPVVFMDDADGPDIAERAVGIEEYGYVVKNAGATALLTAVRMGLRRRHSPAATLPAVARVGPAADAPAAPTDQERLVSRIMTFALELAGLGGEQDLYAFIAGRLKEFTGAVLVAMSAYDARARALVMRHIAVDGVIRQRVIDLAGESVTAVASPVSDEAYREIIAARVGFRRTLTEVTFGAIPPIAGTLIQKILKVDRFYGIAFVIDGSLFATAVVGMEPGREDPPYQLLETMAHLGTLSLRRRIAEDELRESHEKYRDLVENINDLIFSLDAEGRITYMSPVIEQISGYRVAEILGRHFTDFVHPDDVAGLAASFDRILKGIMEPAEFRIVDRDGSARYVRSSSRLIVDNGRVVGARGVLTDITERRQAEERLAAALTEKTSLLHELQHRVKNSLTMISSLVDLEAGQSAHEEVRRALGALGDRIQTMARLYTLLYRSGETQRVRLDHYCAAVCDALMESHADRGARTVLIHELAAVTVDVRRASNLGLILNELVTNALKHAPVPDRKGTITVSLASAGEHLVLTVTDTGPGLPPGFDPAAASGFGLTLVRMLVASMKGSLQFDRGGPGRFVVRMPLAE